MPQQDENKNPNIHIGGNIEGGNILIGSRQTVHGDLSIKIGNYSGVPDDGGAQLKELINQLLVELTKIPEDQTGEVQEVKLATEDALAEVEKEHPDKKRLEIRGKALVSAAKNLLTVAPIAVQIAKTLLLIG